MTDTAIGATCQSSGTDPESMVGRLLEVARVKTGMDLAWVSRFNDTSQVLEVVSGNSPSGMPRAGTHTPLQDSYCALVVAGQMPSVINDTAANPLTSGLKVTDSLAIGSYIGVPRIDSSGRIRGMVCAIRATPNPDVGADEVAFMELVANSVEDLLDEDRWSNQRTSDVRDRVRHVLDHNELLSAFQPIIDLASGEVVGAEALARFPVEPSRPDVWFDEAHRVGMGIDLEVLAVRSGLAATAEVAVDRAIAVNVSPRVLVTEELFETIEAVGGHRVVIELTEHHAVDDYAELGRAVERLRGLGARIAVDDVGAGFASFSHVLALEPDVLKIDISITRGVDSDPARRGLVRGILEAAVPLNATVIAEGVETAAELACLGMLGVHQAQGYLIGRPGPLPLSPEPVTVPAVDDMMSPASDRTSLAERRFARALMEAPAGVALVSLDGAFLEANTALVGQLGYAKEELPGMTVGEVTHPADLALDLDLVEECLHGQRDAYRIAKRFMRRDGTSLEAELIVTIVREAVDRPLFFIAQILERSPAPQL